MIFIYSFRSTLNSLNLPHHVVHFLVFLHHPRKSPSLRYDFFPENHVQTLLQRSPFKLAGDIYIPVTEIDSDTYFDCCHFDCRFIYMTHIGLNNHLRKVHPDGDRLISGPRFDCPLANCHQEYLTKKDLRDHAETHTDAVVDEEDAKRFEKIFPRRLRFETRLLTIDESVKLWRDLAKEEKYDEDQPMYDVIRQVEEKLPEELVRINKMEKAMAAKERRAVKFLTNLEDPIEVERRNAERREEDEIRRMKVS